LKKLKLYLRGPTCKGRRSRRKGKEWERGRKRDVRVGRGKGRER